MPRTIYETGNWRIDQDPTMAARPDLVRFLNIGQTRKALDQIARWTGTGWDQSRWVPRPPKVPQAILDVVEQKMRGAGE